MRAREPTVPFGIPMQQTVVPFKHRPARRRLVYLHLDIINCSTSKLLRRHLRGAFRKNN